MMTSAERTKIYRERLNSDPAKREELLRKRKETNNCLFPFADQ